MPSYVKGQSETAGLRLTVPPMLPPPSHRPVFHLHALRAAVNECSLLLSTRFGKLFPWPPPWGRTASSQSSDTRV